MKDSWCLNSKFSSSREQEMNSVYATWLLLKCFCLFSSMQTNLSLGNGQCWSHVWSLIVKAEHDKKNLIAIAKEDNMTPERPFPSVLLTEPGEVFKKPGRWSKAVTLHRHAFRYPYYILPSTCDTTLPAPFSTTTQKTVPSHRSQEVGSVNTLCQRLLPPGTHPASPTPDLISEGLRAYLLPRPGPREPRGQRNNPPAAPGTPTARPPPRLLHKPAAATSRRRSPQRRPFPHAARPAPPALMAQRLREDATLHLPGAKATATPAPGTPRSPTQLPTSPLWQLELAALPPAGRAAFRAPGPPARPCGTGSPRAAGPPWAREGGGLQLPGDFAAARPGEPAAAVTEGRAPPLGEAVGRAGNAVVGGGGKSVTSAGVCQSFSKVNLSKYTPAPTNAAAQ